MPIPGRGTAIGQVKRDIRILYRREQPEGPRPSKNRQMFYASTDTARSVGASRCVRRKLTGCRRLGAGTGGILLYR